METPAKRKIHLNIRKQRFFYNIRMKINFL